MVLYWMKGCWKGLRNASQFSALCWPLMSLWWVLHWEDWHWCHGCDHESHLTVKLRPLLIFRDQLLQFTLWWPFPTRSECSSLLSEGLDAELGSWVIQTNVILPYISRNFPSSKCSQLCFWLQSPLFIENMFLALNLEGPCLSLSPPSKTLTVMSDPVNSGRFFYSIPKMRWECIPPLYSENYIDPFNLFCLEQTTLACQVTSVMSDSLQPYWPDHSLPGLSVHGIFQARILEWVAVSSSRGSFRFRNRTCIACFSSNGRRVFYH